MNRPTRAINQHSAASNNKVIAVPQVLRRRILRSEIKPDSLTDMLSFVAEPGGDEFPIYWKLLKIFRAVARAGKVWGKGISRMLCGT